MLRQCWSWSTAIRWPSAVAKPYGTSWSKKLLATDPAWKKWDESQESVRKGVSRTQASYIELPPPQLADLPHYVPEYKVVGGLRIIGSELKNAVDQLALGFEKFQPDAKVSTSNIPSSEGAIAGLYYHLSDVARWAMTPRSPT